MADATEFRTSYEVWGLPGRRITIARSHKWNVAARLGPRARGDAANYIRKVEGGLPADGRTALREAMNFLRAPRHVGARATVNTDGRLGYSRTGYLVAFIAFGFCDCRRSILLWAEGTSSRSSGAPRGQPAQSGKVGFCV